MLRVERDPQTPRSSITTDGLNRWDAVPQRPDAGIGGGGAAAAAQVV